MIDYNNKYVMCSIKTAFAVLVLLAVFLLSKTVSEIVSWSKADEIFPSKTIMVTGEGEAVATSDIASFSFSVNERGTTAQEAQENATKKINQAVKYFKDNSVDEKDIKTEYYNINPRYEDIQPCYMFDCPMPSQEIIGYEVSQGVRVKVRDAENAGKFLSEMTQFGISSVSGLSFTIDDEDVLYDEARKNAIEDARAKAQVLAKNLGVQLGDIVSFYEENQGSYYGDMGGMSVREMKVSAVPELPMGENSYTTRVSVTYELK